MTHSVCCFLSLSRAWKTHASLVPWQVDTNMSIFYATKTTTGWMSVRSNIIGGLVSVAVSIFVVYMARPGGFLPLSVGALAISLSLGLTASLGAVTFLVGEMDTRSRSCGIELWQHVAWTLHLTSQIGLALLCGGQ